MRVESAQNENDYTARSTLFERRPKSKDNSLKFLQAKGGRCERKLHTASVGTVRRGDVESTIQLEQVGLSVGVHVLVLLNRGAVGLDKDLQVLKDLGASSGSEAPIRTKNH